MERDDVRVTDLHEGPFRLVAARRRPPTCYNLPLLRVLALCCPGALDVRFAVFAVEYESTQDTLILLPIAFRGGQTLPSSFPKRMRDVNRCSEWQTSAGGPHTLYFATRTGVQKSSACQSLNTEYPQKLFSQIVPQHQLFIHLLPSIDVKRQSSIADRDAQLVSPLPVSRNGISGLRQLHRLESWNPLRSESYSQKSCSNRKRDSKWSCQPLAPLPTYTWVAHDRDIRHSGQRVSTLTRGPKFSYVLCEVYATSYVYQVLKVGCRKLFHRLIGRVASYLRHRYESRCDAKSGTAAWSVRHIALVCCTNSRTHQAQPRHPARVATPQSPPLTRQTCVRLSVRTLGYSCRKGQRFVKTSVIGQSQQRKQSGKDSLLMCCQRQLTVQYGPALQSGDISAYTYLFSKMHAKRILRLACTPEPPQSHRRGANLLRMRRLLLKQDVCKVTCDRSHTPSRAAVTSLTRCHPSTAARKAFESQSTREINPVDNRGSNYEDTVRKVTETRVKVLLPGCPNVCKTTDCMVLESRGASSYFKSEWISICSLSSRKKAVLVQWSAYSILDREWIISHFSTMIFITSQLAALHATQTLCYQVQWSEKLHQRIIQTHKAYRYITLYTESFLGISLWRITATDSVRNVPEDTSVASAIKTPINQVYLKISESTKTQKPHSSPQTP
ncbi:hypothetical protein KCU62_g77, partial [Aureobasidium sp. EXF-3399]